MLELEFIEQGDTKSPTEINLKEFTVCCSVYETEKTVNILIGGKFRGKFTKQ